jgi:hypothetical protein
MKMQDTYLKTHYNTISLQKNIFWIKQENYKVKHEHH